MYRSSQNDRKQYLLNLIITREKDIKIAKEELEYIEKQLKKGDE